MLAGLVAAYSDPKGGGWATSGYVRDATLLVLPATVFFFLSRPKRSSWSWKDITIAALLLVPLLLHGLLGARRGPTFLALATIGGGSYLARRTRPAAMTVLIGGACAGLLLLILVSFRGQIYLGSDLMEGEGPGVGTMVEQALENRSRAHLENEFLFGTYVVLDARQDQDFWWGRRLLTQVFVRPIPSSIWPG